jgi:hypothetical protein
MWLYIEDVEGVNINRADWFERREGYALATLSCLRFSKVLFATRKCTGFGKGTGQLDGETL